MSCGQIALERAGIKVDNYYASEIDKYAIQITQKNYPGTVQLGDVTKWREWDLPEIDLVIGGSPCQSLSIVQSQTRQNLDGKSKLFFEFVDILGHIKARKPDVKFLFENVASMKKDCKQVISEQLGCCPVFIDSASFSAQQRPRYYWTNISNDLVCFGSYLTLADILEETVDDKFWYNVGFDYMGEDKSVQAILHINGHDILKRVHSRNAKCHTLTTCGGGNTQKKVYIDGRCRKLTPTEYERLQTVPDGYTEGVANTHRYNMLGNGWTVDVISHILKGLSPK